MTQQAQDRLAKLPKAWIAKKQEVAEDLFLLWLRPEAPFQFKPGQYITIGTGGIERPLLDSLGTVRAAHRAVRGVRAA